MDGKVRRILRIQEETPLDDQEETCDSSRRNRNQVEREDGVRLGLPRPAEEGGDSSQIVPSHQRPQHDRHCEASSQGVFSRTRRPTFIVDHAVWYRDAFEWLDLEWVTLTNSVRNYIERWYRTFKDRTKRFYNNFGIRDGRRAIKRIERFTHMFAYWYNHVRPHETLKRATPSSLS